VAVGFALREAARALRRAGCDTPRLDAEVLLARVTGLDRAALLAHPERELSPAELESFRACVARRRRREPLAYILGRREFLSLDFEVRPGVLVPRPETELLVEVAADLARRRLEALSAQLDTGTGGPAARLPHRLDLADVGTGSGAVAVGLARLVPQAVVWATDIFETALEVARRNADRLAPGRVRLRRGDLLSALDSEEPRPLLDGIVANLPYVADGEWPLLPPEVREYEPRESLVGGRDGLDLVRRLADQLPGYLAPGGFVCLEVAPGQVGRTEDILLRTGLFRRTRVHRDLAGRGRVVAAVQEDNPAGGGKD